MARIRPAEIAGKTKPSQRQPNPGHNMGRLARPTILQPGMEWRRDTFCLVLGQCCWSIVHHDMAVSQVKQERVSRDAISPGD